MIAVAEIPNLIVGPGLHPRLFQVFHLLMGDNFFLHLLPIVVVNFNVNIVVNVLFGKGDTLKSE